MDAPEMFNKALVVDVDTAPFAEIPVLVFRINDWRTQLEINFC
jgi:hypothetical protein